MVDGPVALIMVMVSIPLVCPHGNMEDLIVTTSSYGRIDPPVATKTALP